MSTEVVVCGEAMLPVQAVTAQRVFGIVRTTGPDEAVAAAEAVLDAGLNAVEIALTTPRALTARPTSPRPGRAP